MAIPKAVVLDDALLRWRTAPMLPTLYRFIYGGGDGFRTTMDLKAATRVEQRAQGVVSGG